MVEVTLLLSQDTNKHSAGINLLDGLKLQFGGDNKTERRRVTGAADTFSRVITSALTVPQITYSLNLFNLERNIAFDVINRTAKGSTTAGLSAKSADILNLAHITSHEFDASLLK